MDKIIIGAPKMKNNNGGIKLFFFQYYDSNIGFFSFASFIVVALYLICFIFTLSKVITLPTIVVNISQS